LRAFAEAGEIMVLNLCDGSDIDSSPGVSVVRALEGAGIPFTGGASHFYSITTPKVMMKEELRKKGVPTPPFIALRNPPQDTLRLESQVGFPALIKPEVSAGSNGISLHSLVRDAPSAEAQVMRLFQSDDGEFYRQSGVFAERFIEGSEFTVLVVGNHEQPEKARVYPPVERIFHSALPPNERFLSYDRYWSEFKEEPRPPAGEPFYRYALAPASLRAALADLARRAFFALEGTGYARVDIRRDDASGRLFVLEVNSNCGLSGDRQTSVGEILHLTGVPIQSLISEILRAAADRHKLQTTDEPGGNGRKQNQEPQMNADKRR
jgi:D-alanine-D-alanine ligase